MKENIANSIITEILKILSEKGKAIAGMAITPLGRVAGKVGKGELTRLDPWENMKRKKKFW